MRPDSETKELTLVAIHRGAIVEWARGVAAGNRAANRVKTTEPPTDEEFVVLRQPHVPAAAARGGSF